MKSPVYLITLVICFFIISSCKSVNIISGGSSSKEIGANGGTVTSSDGKVTLTFPIGALSASETITITKISLDQLGPELEELRSSYTIGSVYELSPDGLEFDSPVHAEIISDQITGTQNGKIELAAEILASSRNGVLSVLGNAGIRLHMDSKVTIHGELSGFSKLVQVIDVGYSVSTSTTEDIEQSLNAGRTLKSNISVTPKINFDIEKNNILSIRQTYQRPLSFLDASDIELVEVKSGPQGQLFGSRRTFNYQCTNNGKGFLETRAGFTFPESEGGDILQNSPYEMSIEQVINCLIPEDSEEDEEYDFSISNINTSLDNTPGSLRLNFSYNISPEIAEDSFFKVDWGNGMIETFELNGSENNLTLEDTQKMSLSHKYIRAGSFDIRVEGWGYKNPDIQSGQSVSGANLVRQLGTHGLLGNEFINSEWTSNQNFDDLLENRFTHSLKDRMAWGVTADVPPVLTTSDNHLKINFSNYDRFKENLPAAIPNFSVDKIDIIENFWIYQLNYPTEFTERFDLSPSFSYSEFPNEQENQPLEFDLNLDQAIPIIIQLDEFWNPVLIDDMDLFNPNRPTRLISPTLFQELQMEQKVFDFQETTVEIPGHTLRVFKDGNGTGRVIGSSDFNRFIECRANCSHDFQEGTTVSLTAFPDPGSEFIRYSDNTSPIGLFSSTITIDDYTTVTATFMKKEEEDSDPKSPSITLDETGFIRGQVTHNGSGLPGAIVKLQGVSGHNRITYTNAEGLYRNLNLPSDDYSISADSEGLVCSQTEVEPVFDPEVDYDSAEYFRNVTINFECVRTDEGLQDDETIAQENPTGGLKVQDRTWFPGGYQIGINAGYPFRPTLIDFVEDQENIDDAEVTNISPTFGIRTGFDIVRLEPYTISADVGFLTGTYDYFQSDLNRTRVDGTVRVNEILTGLRVNRNDWWSRPYFKTGLNTVLNKSENKIQNPFTLETENEERDHTGLNFLFGGGIDVDLSDDLNLSIGANYNIGGADSRLLLNAGINFGW